MPKAKIQLEDLTPEQRERLKAWIDQTLEILAEDLNLNLRAVMKWLTDVVGVYLELAKEYERKSKGPGNT